MNQLVIMAKLPVMGAVKTRLARDIGPAAAVAAARLMLDDLLRRVGRDRHWRTILALSPPSALRAGRWPRTDGQVAQAPGDLGAKLTNVFQRLLPNGPVVIVGADCPDMQADDIRRAFHALRAHRAVLGPATDGGYWLVGLARPRRNIFQKVRWSTEHARADTLAGMSGMRVALLDTLTDIDSGDDYRQWRRRTRSARRLKGS